jgi:hypothetical protein
MPCCFFIPALLELSGSSAASTCSQCQAGTYGTGSGQSLRRSRARIPKSKGVFFHRSRSIKSGDYTRLFIVQLCPTMHTHTTLHLVANIDQRAHQIHARRCVKLCIWVTKQGPWRLFGLRCMGMQAPLPMSTAACARQGPS